MNAAEQLLGHGFELIGSYVADPESASRLLVNFDVRSVPRMQGVYVFVCGHDVVYAGSSIGYGGGLQSRLKKYTAPRDISAEGYKGRPVHRLLRSLAADGWQIDIYIHVPKDRFQPLAGSELQVDLVAGIEGWLIEKYRPCGNRRGSDSAVACVRSATTADLPAIRSVLVDTWHATYDSIFGAEMVTGITDRWHAVQMLRPQLGGESSTFLVAERRGAIVGTLYARAACNGSVSLERLYVLPQAQGSGIGRRLYDAMRARFPAAKSIRLEVEPRNAPAIAFYRRIGFAEVGAGAACGGDAAAAIPHLIMQITLDA